MDLQLSGKIAIATERLQIRIQNYARHNNIDLEETAKRMPREMKIARFGDPAEIARGCFSRLAATRTL